MNLPHTLKGGNVEIIWKFSYFNGHFWFHIREYFEWNIRNWKSKNWNYFYVTGNDWFTKLIAILFQPHKLKKKGNDLIRQWQKDSDLKKILKEEKIKRKRNDK